ncbi:MAG: DNA repair protein RadC [Bacteroidota bacterium]
MKTYDREKLAITAWAEEDRPREKLLQKGKQVLSDAELLAILLGSGSREDTAVGLAKKILNFVENSLNDLGKCSLAELQRFKGIGEAKAITIAAAMELGRRRQMSPLKDRPQIRSSSDAFRAIAPTLIDLTHEEFWILLLNRSNAVIGKELVSTGGVSGTVVDAKMVFRKALEKPGATSIILCHNHPSGALRPSQEDKVLTKKLKQAGQVLDMVIFDHLIVSERGYFSFADEGMF